MDDFLKNDWLENTLSNLIRDKKNIDKLLAAILVSDVLIPMEFYLDGKEFNRKNVIHAIKNNKLKVSYLLADIEGDGDKKLVIFTSNSRASYGIPENFYLIKIKFIDFLLNEYDRNLKGVIINPYHEGINLNSMHIEVMLSALAECKNEGN